MIHLLPAGLKFTVFLKVVLTGCFRTTLVVVLIVLEMAIALILVIAKLLPFLLPAPKRIAFIRKRVEGVDPYSALKADNSPGGLLARLFL